MTQRNEGEGNKSAARRYNEKTERFARSGKVPSGAEAARQAIDGAERKDLERAENIGKARAKGEDPAVRGRHSGSHK